MSRNPEYNARRDSLNSTERLPVVSTKQVANDGANSMSRKQTDNVKIAIEIAGKEPKSTGKYRIRRQYTNSKRKPSASATEDVILKMDPIISLRLLPFDWISRDLIIIPH